MPLVPDVGTEAFHGKNDVANGHYGHGRRIASWIL